MNAGADSGGELRRVCDALGLAASAAQLAQLERYLDALQRWNAAYNLTAVRERGAMVTQHLADCLSVVEPINRHLSGRTGARLLDVGSGGGLPGVVLAVMLPTLDVTCVDAVGKKIAFVRQIAGVLGLPHLHAQHARVEALSSGPFHIITSRAFSSLGDFVTLTHRQLAGGGVWAAMKGKVPLEEIGALGSDVAMFHVEQLQVPGLDAERCVIWMRRRSDAPGNSATLSQSCAPR